MSSSFSYLSFFHSSLRYFILLFAIISVIQSLSGMLGKKSFGRNNKTFALLLLICCDVQLLLGLALYYVGGWLHVLQSPGVMKDTYSRFYAVEHSVGMIIAIVLVHVGYTVTKKNVDADHKFKRLFWCNFTALAIFMATIPWQSKPIVGKPNIPVLGAHS